MKTQILKSIFLFCILHVAFCIYSNAQIVYTDVMPDITISTGVGANTQIYNIDLNGDGINDYVLTSFRHISMSWKTGFLYTTSYTQITALGANKFASTFGWAGILNQNDLVSSVLLWNNSPSQYLKYNYQVKTTPTQTTYQSQGLWDNAVDKYVGLKIIVGGQIYYGWVRLNVTVSLASALLTIKDYAYNSIPGQSILAGETSCTTPTANLTASGPLSFCAGDSVTLTANGTGYQYQWKKNGVNIIGATLQTYVAKTSGKYKCAATNSCGSKTSKTDTVKVPCRNSDTSFLIIANDEPEHLSIFPNPATNSIIIKFPSDKAGEIQIVNLFGLILFSEKINTLQTKIDVTQFPPGLYIAQWSSGENNETKKFLVAK